MMDYSVFPSNQAPVLLSTTFLFNCLLVIFVFMQSPQFTSSDTGPIVFSEGNHNWTHLQSYIGYTNDPWGETASELSQHSSALSESTRHNVSHRGKRSVVHLYNLIVCATDCNPLAYKGYGCYCGFLGSGYSMDPIDSCCKMHDWCYTTADCPMFLEYFVPYVWTCYRRRPLCAIGASCGQRLCECDRKLAECLRRFPCPRSKAVCTSSPWRLLQNILML